MDHCELHGQTLLVVSENYRNYIEVAVIFCHKLTSAGVTKALMPLFAMYGVLDTLMTDNRAQFDSTEFESFTKKWALKHDV